MNERQSRSLRMVHWGSTSAAHAGVLALCLGLGMTGCSSYVSDSAERQKWQDSCEDGDKKDCARLGQAMVEDESIRDHLPETLEFLGKGCKGKVADACWTLGRLYDDDIGLSGVKAKPEKARKYFDLGCEGKPIEKDEKQVGKDIASCFELGRMYKTGRGGKKDPDKALSLLGKACENGHLRACSVLGEGLEKGEGFDVDKKKAGEVFAKGCKSKEGDDSDLLDMCEKAASTIGDAAESIALYERVCKAGRFDSCESLAIVYTKMEQYERAFPFLSKACELATEKSEFTTCQLGGNIGAFKLGKSKEAERLAKRGCDNKDGGSCYALASLYISNDSGLPRDRDKSISIMRQGCDYGYSDACKVVRSL